MLWLPLAPHRVGVGKWDPPPGATPAHSQSLSRVHQGVCRGAARGHLVGWGGHQDRQPPGQMDARTDGPPPLGLGGAGTPAPLSAQRQPAEPRGQPGGGTPRILGEPGTCAGGGGPRAPPAPFPTAGFMPGGVPTHVCGPVPVPGDVTAAAPLHHPPGRCPPPGTGYSAEPPPARPVGQGAKAGGCPRGRHRDRGLWDGREGRGGGARGRGVE